jgi:hypothetical protein
VKAQRFLRRERATVTTHDFFGERATVTTQSEGENGHQLIRFPLRIQFLERSKEVTVTKNNQVVRGVGPEIDVKHVSALRE